MITNLTLQLCPFCGSYAKCENGFSPCESVYVVQCSNTDCFLNDIEHPPTIDEWNTRDFTRD